ncbi:potassium-transporting ATPase subunit KdpA [Aeromicrobium sp. Root472D3]|uniref:potassium-transporting ATPase subunit KdpA n=1 Tax=Aeromicrobium TaxID=2040 RepID=UPI0006FF158E|nr:potassium-transporting ATPase subunit KdpA [Aeromicrobium sp. Root472D3]KQX75879.1 potassium-transporting ATPase subunit A [Aeromicrobium sp. Root472D3]MBD8606435.1 potassium-transporting ATPase subunit KdpA [Aeromicrobium sp. CFBP 8757]
MSDTLSGLLTIVTLVGVLALVYVPLGDYMARVFTTPRHSRVEKGIYRLGGVNADAEQSPRAYILSVLGFSVVSLVVLYGILVGQSHLPFDRDLPGMPGWMAFNTSISFVANTNWQSYGGESTLGFAAQMAGLAVQNFLSAAVGIAVAVALIRGFVRVRSGELGNFWVDLTRSTIRILLPIAFVGAVVLLLNGVVQNFADSTITTLAGHSQVVTGGPVASQEAIKELGTNGGGFFNANSAHPFENPNGFTNLLQIFLILLIPVALTRTLGTMLGNRRQGLVILGAMGLIFSVMTAVATWAEVGGHSQSAAAAGAAMEGKETRFGEWASSLFAVATTGTSTGAVNASHDSLTPTGGGVTLVNMMLGEIAPGGVGAGIYGILVMAVLAVFVAGLMVGRTPELLGKKIAAKEMTFVALYTLATPTLVLVGVGTAIALNSTPGAMGNPGGHGFTEVVYAYTSGANNNGSAFGGITVTSTFFQITIGLAMLLGRFIPIVLVLLLAGSLAKQAKVPETAGTLPTNTPLFGGLLVGVILLITGLTFFPALALGPIAEALS